MTEKHKNPNRFWGKYSLLLIAVVMVCGAALFQQDARRLKDKYDAGSESMIASERVDLGRTGCKATGPDGKQLVQSTPAGQKFHIPKNSTLSGECFAFAVDDK